MGQTVILRGPSQRSFAKQLIDRAPTDTVVTIREATRTNDQNAKMWAMLSDVSVPSRRAGKWTPDVEGSVHARPSAIRCNSAKASTALARSRPASGHPGSRFGR